MTSRKLGLYALISPGADPRVHTLELELTASKLVRIAAGSEDGAIEATLSWLARGRVHLIELGDGWSHQGVARLCAAVGRSSIVTARWFPPSPVRDRIPAPVRRANVFFCTTPNVCARLDTPSDLIWFVGINGPDQGVEMCRRLVEEQGIQVLELCSDWGFEGAARVQDAVGPDVPVGLSLHQALDAGRRAATLYVPAPFSTKDRTSQRAPDGDRMPGRLASCAVKWDPRKMRARKDSRHGRASEPGASQLPPA